MKIFITGATGYIGNGLASKLAKSGHIVHALIRHAGSGRHNFHPNVILFEGDILNRQSISAAMSGCDQVYHLAGFAKLWCSNKETFYTVNVTGTRNVLAMALEKGIKKLVYTSTCGVFGNSLRHPLSEKDPRVSSFENDYDLSKHICECMVKEYVQKGLAAVIVNPSRVYGPGPETPSNPFSGLIQRCLKGKKVFIPGPKKVIGNYAFIDDVVHGHIAAMQHGLPGERYILGGENLSYEEVIKIIKNQIANSRVIQVPPSILKTMAYWNLVKRYVAGIEPVLTPGVVGRLTRNAAMDCSKAIKQLNYSITPFHEGIRITIANSNNMSHA